MTAEQHEQQAHAPDDESTTDDRETPRPETGPQPDSEHVLLRALERVIGEAKERERVGTDNPWDAWQEELTRRRDVALDRLTVRLRWFGEDVTRTSERVKEYGEYAIPLVSYLSHIMQDIDRLAGQGEAWGEIREMRQEEDP